MCVCLVCVGVCVCVWGVSGVCGGEWCVCVFGLCVCGVSVATNIEF